MADLPVKTEASDTIIKAHKKYHHFLIQGGVPDLGQSAIAAAVLTLAEEIKLLNIELSKQQPAKK